MDKKILIKLLCILGPFTLLMAQNPLYIPPVLHGPVYNLEMKHGTHIMYKDTKSSTMGYNGDILGPTLILEAGEEVIMKVTNSLGEESTVHWHGLHVHPEDDGGPHSVIEPNETASMDFTVLDKASTYWYHPHLHHHTFEQVSLGLSGMIIVRDEEEADLKLPRTYGVDDFPIILQTKAFDANSNILYGQVANSGTGWSNGMAWTNDDIPMVNATVDPYLDVPQQMVRLRILNGAAHRVFEVGLSNNGGFFQIASDGGLLEEPYEINRLRLSPGERAEIIVDFSKYSKGPKVELVSYGSELPDGIWGANRPFLNNDGPSPAQSNSLNGADFLLMHFNVIGANNNSVQSVPTELVEVTQLEISQANKTRRKELGPGGVASASRQGIADGNDDALKFDINFTNDTIQLDAIEIWEVFTPAGDMGQYHPFHIHDAQFYILDREKNGVVTLPHPGEQGRKDVVLIEAGETVRLIMQFKDFVSDIPYVYHCHILPHEDQGMMSQFIVQELTNLLFVSNDADASIENGSRARPYATLRNAVKSIPAGQTETVEIVFLSFGFYEEVPPNLLIDKKVLMMVENPDQIPYFPAIIK